MSLYFCCYQQPFAFFGDGCSQHRRCRKVSHHCMCWESVCNSGNNGQTNSVYPSDIAEPRYSTMASRSMFGDKGKSKLCSYSPACTILARATAWCDPLGWITTVLKCSSNHVILLIERISESCKWPQRKSYFLRCRPRRISKSSHDSGSFGTRRFCRNRRGNVCRRCWWKR